jgi:lysosomal Pro-X carboxypeptidase
MMHPLRRFLLLLLLLLVGLLPAAVWSLAPPRFPRHQHRSRPGVNGVGDYEYETRYFRQRLDHFSFPGVADEDEAAAFFQQRYLVGRGGGWAGPGGPIFFYCGNEGDIAWFASNSGLVWEAAPRFAALVVFAEAILLPRPLSSRIRVYSSFSLSVWNAVFMVRATVSLVCCAASLLRRVHAVW